MNQLRALTIERAEWPIVRTIPPVRGTSEKLIAETTQTGVAGQRPTIVRIDTEIAHATRARTRRWQI
eukprot:9271574-Lingulodinium_polyedra.AAC.1